MFTAAAITATVLSVFFGIRAWNSENAAMLAAFAACFACAAMLWLALMC